MNITVKKSIYGGFFALALFAFFGVATAFASTTFNTDPLDNSNGFGTVRVSNYTANPGTTTCWSFTIPGSNPQGCSNPTLQAGDLVSIAIYYHNTGTQSATNTRVKLSSMSGTNNSFNVSGGVWADNASYASGSASFNISSSQSVTYNNCFWYPNQTQAAQPCPGNGSDVLTSGGLNIGTVAPGWPTQGSVVIRMRVSNNVPPPPQTYACNDGYDNDNDGKTDFPFDPGCTSSTDNDEYNSAPCTSCCTNNCNTPTIQTLSATNVTKYTARLNAHYDTNNTISYTWFEWGKNSFTESTADATRYYNEDDIWTNISNLQAGTTYMVRACIKNASSNGDICDGTKYFTTPTDGCGNDCGCTNDCGGCNDNCNDENLEVDTLSAEDIDEDSAMLVGEINSDSDNVIRWFEWGTDEDDLDETLDLSGNQDGDGEFSKRLDDLDEDEKYYYRACGEDDNGDEDCGSIRSFTTDDDNNNDDNGDAPQVSTTNPSSVTQTSARLNGVVDINNDEDTQVWFEWGTSSNLSSDTNKIDAIDTTHLSGDTYSFGSTITGLRSGTIYYFRAVAENDEGDDFGSVFSFRTIDNTIIPMTPTPIIYNTTVLGASTGSESLIMLEIDPRESNVYPGERITYNVHYKNISGKTLKDVVLNIQFPRELGFMGTDEGEYSSKDHELTLELGTLNAGEEDEFDVDVRVAQDAERGNLLVTSATMAFTTPSGAQEDAIAYALHTVERNYNALAGLALFGADGFLPNTLIGWLILVLIVVALAMLARRAFGTKPATQRLPGQF